jgi:hypothetical protein
VDFLPGPFLPYPTLENRNLIYIAIKLGLRAACPYISRDVIKALDRVEKVQKFVHRKK